MNPDDVSQRGLRVYRDGELVHDYGRAAQERQERIAAVSAAADRAIDNARENGQLPTPVRRSGMRTPNERLDQALREAGLRPDQLARKIGVTPSTVERWLDNSDRIPYPVHQFAVEKIVGTDISELWPERSSNASKPKNPERENRRLRDALFEARITPAQIAERLGVNQASVEGWLSRGRVPQRKVRDAVALEVGISARELWPTLTHRNRYTSERSRSAQPPAGQPGGGEAEPGDSTPSACSANPRLRALMSWVDTSTSAQRAIPHRDPDFGRRRRGDGLEHTR
ncbi:helix-turn-helix transcriptional regulator [Nocardia asteroides]|uniref:helix-turn-helix transcriptional regulator n=1 Tax=Nocardia asteroides TaxID=1824 RepID=UPI0033F75C16